MSNNYNNFTNVTNVTIIEDPAELSFAKPLAHLCQVPVEEINVRDFLTIEEFLHTAFTVVVFLAVAPAIGSTFLLFKHSVYKNIIRPVKAKVKSITNKTKEKVKDKINTIVPEGEKEIAATKIEPSLPINKKEVIQRRKTLDSAMVKFRKSAHFAARSSSFSGVKTSPLSSPKLKRTNSFSGFSNMIKSKSLSITDSIFSIGEDDAEEKEEEDKLEEIQQEKEDPEESEKSKVQAMWLSILHALLAFFTGSYYFYTRLSLSKPILCLCGHMVILPLFKPFSLSMWPALMPLVQYVHWKSYHKHKLKDYNNHILPGYMPFRRMIISVVYAWLVGILWTLYVFATMPFWPLLIIGSLVVFPVMISISFVLLHLPVQIFKGRGMCCRCYICCYRKHDLAKLDDEKEEYLEAFAKIHGVYEENLTDDSKKKKKKIAKTDWKEFLDEKVFDGHLLAAKTFKIEQEEKAEEEAEAEKKAAEEKEKNTIHVPSDIAALENDAVEEEEDEEEEDEEEEDEEEEDEEEDEDGEEDGEEEEDGIENEDAASEQLDILTLKALMVMFVACNASALYFVELYSGDLSTVDGMYGKYSELLAKFPLKFVDINIALNFFVPLISFKWLTTFQVLFTLPKEIGFQIPMIGAFGLLFIEASTMAVWKLHLVCKKQRIHYRLLLIPLFFLKIPFTFSTYFFMIFEMLWEIIVALYGLPTLGMLIIYQWIKRKLSELDEKASCCFKNCKCCYNEKDEHCCYRFCGRCCKRKEENVYRYRDKLSTDDKEDEEINLLELQIKSYQYSLLGSVGKSGFFTIFQWRYKKKEKAIEDTKKKRREVMVAKNLIRVREEEMLESIQSLCTSCKKLVEAREEEKKQQSYRFNNRSYDEEGDEGIQTNNENEVVKAHENVSSKEQKNEMNLLLEREKALNDSIAPYNKIKKQYDEERKEKKKRRLTRFRSMNKENGLKDEYFLHKQSRAKAAKNFEEELQRIKSEIKKDEGKSKLVDSLIKVKSGIDTLHDFATEEIIALKDPLEVLTGVKFNEEVDTLIDTEFTQKNFSRLHVLEKYQHKYYNVGSGESKPKRMDAVGNKTPQAEGNKKIGGTSEAELEAKKKLRNLEKNIAKYQKQKIKQETATLDEWRKTVGSQITKSVVVMWANNNMSKIRQCELEDHRLGHVGVLALLDAILKKGVPMEELYLRNNDIGERKSKMICSKLKEITTLRRLDLEDNDFGNGFATAAGKYLLDKNDHLESLNLKNNDIYSNGAVHIANGLSWNKCLTEFDLSGNPLHLKKMANGTEKESKDGYVQIAKVLKENNKTLDNKKLHLFSGGNVAKEHTTFVKECQDEIGQALQSRVTDVKIQRLARKRSRIKEFSLRKGGDNGDKLVDDKTARNVAEAIKENVTLEMLDLSENKITAGGAYEISRVLRQQEHLLILDLSNNRIDNANDLLTALETNRVLHTLKLNGNPICKEKQNYIQDTKASLDFAKSLLAAMKQNKSLTSLNIEKIGLKDVIPPLPSKTKCRIYKNAELITCEVVKASQANHGYIVQLIDPNNLQPPLYTVASSDVMPPEGENWPKSSGRMLADILTANTKLKHLSVDIEFSKLSSQAIAKALSVNKGLETLDCPQLDVLPIMKLRKNQIRGMLSLENKRLSFVHLWVLAELLRDTKKRKYKNEKDSGEERTSKKWKLSKVTELCLSNCNVTEELAEIIAFEIITDNSTLREIDLSVNKLIDTSFQELVDAWHPKAHLYVLALDYKEYNSVIFKDKDPIKHKWVNPCIAKYHNVMKSRVFPLALLGVRKATKPCRLIIGKKNKRRSNHLDFEKQIRDGKKDKDKVLYIINKEFDVDVLKLSANDAMEVAKLLEESTSKKCCLVELHIKAPIAEGIDGSGVRDICKALKKNTVLKTLDLYDSLENENVRSLLKSLEQNHTLTELKMENVHLSKLRSNFNAMLSKNRSLKHLIFMSSPLEDEIGVGIGEGLQENTTLDKLILTGNNFKETAFKAISEGLRHNDRVKTLILKKKKDLDLWHGIYHLAKGLENNSSLQHLSLEGNPVGLNIHENKIASSSLQMEEGVAQTDSIQRRRSTTIRVMSCFSNVLKHNQSIQILNISNALLNDTNGQDIKELVKSNTVLQDLNLAGNDIRTNGATAIAAGLKTNKTLTRLNLKDNDGINTQGGIEIVKALQGKSHILNLNLAYCGIGGDKNKKLMMKFYQAMQKLLRKHKSFHRLDVHKNPLVTDVVTEIPADAVLLWKKRGYAIKDKIQMKEAWRIMAVEYEGGEEVSLHTVEKYRALPMSPNQLKPEDFLETKLVLHEPQWHFGRPPTRGLKDHIVSNHIQVSPKYKKNMKKKIDIFHKLGVLGHSGGGENTDQDH